MTRAAVPGRPLVRWRAAVAGAGDSGAAVVAAVVLVVLLVVAVLVGAAATDLLAARQRAAAAADLGALAGAPAADRSTGEACRAAEWVVRSNGASLRACAVADGDVRVTASARLRGPWSRWLFSLLAGPVEPQATARAGMR